MSILPTPMPELLAPAGSLEKLKVAVLYGAGAVYCGGLKFGLRAASENFTLHELEQGLSFAHQRGAKVFVVLNGFLRARDIQELGSFARELESLGVDAVITADAGVMRTVARHTRLPMHLSTQASCLNVGSALMWKEMGAKRLVLGRETSLEDARAIKQASGLEIEMFVHGSMCMAYSGHCVISNYTQGRDSNRGGCAHSCRFEYTLESQGQRQSAYFMSSKDLNALALLPLFAQAGIDSLKIEGRNKGPMYAAQATKCYAQALKLLNVGQWSPENLALLEAELRAMSHRDYTPASLLSPAGADSVYDKREAEEKLHDVAAVVREVGTDYLLLEARSSFGVGDLLELLPFDGAPIPFRVGEIARAVAGPAPGRARPGLLARVPRPAGEAQEWNLVRRRLEAHA